MATWEGPWCLCGSHIRTCRLENGETLRVVLDRVRPESFPLEGNLLGYLFNPVFVTNENGSTAKGWTDWLAGGMAVYEDRFEAVDYFEFAAFEGAYGCRVLYELYSLGADTLQLVRRMKEDRWVAEAHHRIDDHYQLVRYYEDRFDRRRRESRHHYPHSFDELSDWLNFEKLKPRQSVSIDDPFFESLRKLATRRFAPASEPQSE